MIILGVNGWFTRSHDGSAALIKDGKIVAFAEEERFTRYKHAFEQLPHRAIQSCLDKAGITSDEIDVLAIGWDYELKYRLRNIEFPDTDLADLYLPKDIFKRKKEPKVVIVNHHLAHASLAYRLSKADKSAILVVDGQGEDSSISIWKGNDGEIELIQKYPLEASVGFFYESINKMIGFDYFDSGKTMGLSSYSQDSLEITEIDTYGSDVTFNLPNKIEFRNDCLDEQMQFMDAWDKVYSKYGLKKSEQKNMNSAFYENEYLLAGTAQKNLERIMLKLVFIAKEIVGTDNICIAGGTTLNCNVNSIIKKSNIFKNVFVFPVTNDTGVSLGAALETSYNEGGEKFYDFTPYLGPDFSDTEIEDCLIRHKLHYAKSENVAKEAAKYLSEGKIIAWFQGRMEAGPRALGNRSIIANPTIKGMNDKVNNIKNRELWRPLAPSVLADYAEEIFDDSFYSPYMLHTFNIKQDYLSRIPAVCHVDKSARPQMVKIDDNPLFYSLIDEFKNTTGVPIVLNTSLNGPGEPLICKPDEAAKILLRTKIDYLFIGNYIAWK